MQIPVWRAIEEAKESRLQKLDLGRSGVNDQGLILFKDRLGAKRATITHLCPEGSQHMPFAALRHNGALA